MHIALSRDFYGLHLEVFVAIEEEPAIGLEKQRELLGISVMAAEEAVEKVAKGFNEKWLERLEKENSE